MESPNPPQTLHQAIQRKFGLPTACEDGSSTKLNSDPILEPAGMPKSKLVIPLLMPQQTSTPDKAREATAARNKMLLDELRRRQDKDAGNAKPPAFVIPQLGEPLGGGKLSNSPLIRLESGVKRLNISGGSSDSSSINSSICSSSSGIGSSSGGDGPTMAPGIEDADMPLIDLTGLIIDSQKGAPVKETASKARERQQATGDKSFAIPFIACDSGTRRKLSGGLLDSRRRFLKDEETAETLPKKPAEEEDAPSPIGRLLDTYVSRREPGVHYVKFGATRLERLHLKICFGQLFDGPVKRFRFDTPSPDAVVKQTLLKTSRISHT
ncbi:hypothetical protein KR018_005892 [Drosophila ironensis]|nr:hypothetical protein KR018_005892 [Drosophila ironensis]